MAEKQYHIPQNYRRDKARRRRKSVHSSRLPYWLARQPLVQKFSRMSRKRKIFLIGWTGISALVVIGLFTTIYFANTLASKERIMNRNKTGVTLLDQNNQKFYSFYNAHSNTYVTLDKISDSAKQAIISSEDKDFYNHAGFSPKGILNAFWQNIRPNGLDNGGSTLTQQLIGTALFSEERSYIKKYQELILSIEIERRYSKDEILEMYLNSVYFGEGAFGIEDASQIYFDKPAAQLNTAEASLLIGLLPAPSAYSPITGDANKAKIRQNYVLRRMVEDGKITASDKTAALEAPLIYSNKKRDEESRAPHFALMVKDELEKKYGEEKIARSGYSVKTSLNLDWQTRAETTVRNQVDRLARSNVENGSAVILDPKTGQIRALVGSKDWNNEKFGKFNIATATRQPGSSFKPFVYATGIENKDFSAASIFQDKATDFGSYSPKNYDLRYRGDVTLRRALANSLNIPAIDAILKAGVGESIDTAKKLGLTTLDKVDRNDPSLALGTGPAKLTEMTNAYATFANSGEHNELTTIDSINDKNNRTIYKFKQKTEEAISEQTAYIMSSILSDNTARSELFGSSLNLSGNRPAAVKTGTTENYRDAWTIGYTPSLAVGVWIGNNDETPMSRVAGSSGAAPIWRTLMQDILKGTPNEQFITPRGITARSICRNNGALAKTGGENTMTEYFIPGTLPTATCNEEQPKPQQEPVIRPEEDEETEAENQNNTHNGSGSSNGNNNPGNSGNPNQGNPGNGNQPSSPIPTP